MIRALGLGIAASVAVTAISRVGWLKGWETDAVDLFLWWRDRVPAPEIVIAAIDEDAFQELGERQPLSRGYLADLAEFLLRSGARVVAFDVFFKTATDPEEDNRLLEVARRWAKGEGGRLVFQSVAVPRPKLTPRRYDLLPLFSSELHGFIGYANAPLGEDLGVRLMDPVLPAADGGFLPSFPVAVLAAYARYEPDAVVQLLRRGAPADSLRLPARQGDGRGLREEPVTLATLAGQQWRTDYAGPPGAFTSFPSGALVKLARDGVQPGQDNPFRDKIVLVGATFLESRDFHPTPLGPMAGVEIQANMVHTLLSRRLGQAPHWAVNLAVLIGACLFVAIAPLWLRPIWVGLLSVGLIAAFGFVSYEAYIRGGYWLDFVAPLAGMMAYLQGSRLLARRRLRSAFGQFVSPEVVKRIQRDGAALGGEVRTVSVLMSDLRGFTTLSETLPPQRISEMMNEYFTAMVEVIGAHRGLVNDFIGDGILALFGAPEDDPEHAWHAVLTALAMQGALERLNARWRAEARGPLAMGVAVNTGEVFAGNLGSPRRKKYSVLGDTVNTVARMEGLNRELSTTILISGGTVAAVKDRVVVRERGAIPVKGRARPVEVFELQDVRETADGPPGRSA